MDWRTLPNRCKAYLVLVYILAIPFAYFVLRDGGDYSATWVLFVLASLFVATINLHLPQLPSVVISMGDVFTFLALIHFGPGPALLAYWANIIATALTNNVRRYGWPSLSGMSMHRLLFNLACSALSIWAMAQAYAFASQHGFGYPADLILGLGTVALVWFVINTCTISLALAFSSGDSFLSVWQEGLGLYLLNFFGSAAAAGLISLFLERAGFSIFLLSLPVAVVLYQLYAFYVEKYQQAQVHISELNELYLQAIEAMADVVDAKDKYTHGHIRRVQAYAVTLGKCMGIVGDKEVMAIRAGALLHDIGKIAIPEYILNKPTVLTETEFEKMKIHPVVGANMLKNINFPYPVIPIVKSHHERWDGKGYPDGLFGEEIPLSARILSLVDCYDALTTDRPYRAPMNRQQVVEFFHRESGRAYDPKIVEMFVNNLDTISAAGRAVEIPEIDPWRIEVQPEGPDIRKLERVQPIVTYGKALHAGAEVQRELYSIFEFARAEIQCLTAKDVLTFVGSKLSNLITFDAGIFFMADLDRGIVTAEHVLGLHASGLETMSLGLEQKLTGWVAANRQALCNLPPFPDFLGCSEPRPDFELSAIVPIHRSGTVYGAVSLYRKEKVKFTEEEFRRLEIVASQTALALSKCTKAIGDETVLFDSLTGVPNGFQLYLMFDQIVMDAQRYEYPVALLTINLDDLKVIRRRWGYMLGDEAIRSVAKYLRSELRDTDLLVRYANDEFIALSPRLSREQAEALKSRLQNTLDHFRFTARVDTEIPLPTSIGISIFPEDGGDLEALLSVGEWQMRDDRALRSAVKRRLRHFQSSD